MALITPTSNFKIRKGEFDESIFEGYQENIVGLNCYTHIFLMEYVQL